MKNTALFYALLALGVVALIAGVIMRVAINFHGKAYAVLAFGGVLLVAGIIGMFMGKSSSSAASSK
jgi:hypothetical protein